VAWNEFGIRHSGFTYLAPDAGSKTPTPETPP
jgi:hypothetical protein